MSNDPWKTLPNRLSRTNEILMVPFFVFSCENNRLVNFKLYSVKCSKFFVNISAYAECRSLGSSVQGQFTMPNKMTRYFFVIRKFYTFFGIKFENRHFLSDRFLSDM